MSTLSPLVIDLGANNTGVLMPHFYSEKGLSDALREGLVLHIPDDKLLFAQESRRAKRHQKRGALRRKMAKRLFRLIVANSFHFDVQAQPSPVREALHHAFNNRGFTFLDEGLDPDAVDQPSAAAFLRTHFETFLPSEDNPVSEQLLLLSANLVKVNAIRTTEPFLWNKDEEKRIIADAASDTATRKAISKGLRAVKEYIASIVNSEINGHKPRAQYLENIARDLAGSTLLKPVWSATGLNAMDAARLIGNISNLQLRVLRKYFNDIQMAGMGDGLWKPERMAEFFRRYILTWHAKTPEEKARKSAMLAATAQYGSDIVTLWRSTDPILSIPPMEDMNNRHPTRCATLLLDEGMIQQRIPAWREMISPLMDAVFEQNFSDAIEPARRLQALLDRSKEHDNWHLRSLAFRDPEKPLNKADADSLDRLQQTFGADRVQALISFARDYYREREAADHGDWSEAWPGRVLRICGKNCPRKAKVMHLQMGILLRRTFSEADVDTMRGLFAPGVKVHGSATIHGTAEKVAEAQKTCGAAFKETLVSGRDPELNKLLTLAVLAYDRIASVFGVPATATDRFGKPFVLAQIYNLLERDPHGSSSTCQACSQDNARRSLPFENEAAHARRLPADAGRPFDGMLARLLERQAYEIAKVKITQLEKHAANGPVFMPIILEQNNFEFALGLLSIRKNQIQAAKLKAKDKQKDLETGAENTLALWQEKDLRIRSDSGSCCPYTGQALSATGQIDHIIPRSLSRDWGGTVYNAEANLIFCSTRGNTDKDNSLYDLTRLHAKYLKEQFGTDDRAAITAEIRTKLPSLIADEQAISGFHGLPAEDRKIIRHALFVEDLRGDVLTALQQQKKARVNGTQKWFAKQLSKNIRDLAATKLPGLPIETRTYLVKAEDVHTRRQILAAAQERFRKSQPQSAYSHVVDAGMAWATWLAMAPRAQEMIDIPENSLDQPDWLAALLPGGISILSLASKNRADKTAPQSRSLFKDGIFGNRFLHFVVHKDGAAAFGFHPDNSLPITRNADDAYALLQSFLRWESKPVVGDVAAWRDQARKSKRAYILAVDRTSALDFLHQAAKGPLSPEDSRRADLLDLLSYTIQKKKVRDSITKDSDRNRMTLCARDEVLEEKAFYIKVDAKKSWGVSGKLIHPAFTGWKAIIEDKMLAPFWGNSLPADFDWDAFYARHFPRDLAPAAHRKVRKVYSLPVPADPSGGFRIRRTAADGSPIWQTVASNGSAYDGFAVRAGKPDWNKAQFSPHLKRSPRIHALTARHQPEAGPTPCRMDEWLLVEWNEPHADLLGVEISPGTADRLYVRIRMTGQEFSRVFGQSDPLAMPPDWKWITWPLIIKEPRSHLFFEQIGDTFSFWYIADGAPKELLDAYAAAWAAKHPS